MTEKTQDLERRIAAGESIFDIGRSMEMDLEWCAAIERILSYQDTASELQIEEAKNLALRTLKEVMITAEEDGDRARAANSVLQYYRSEKQRLETRAKEKKMGPPLLGPETGSIFGPWLLRSPSK